MAYSATLLQTRAGVYAYFGVAALGVSVLAVAADALLTKRSGALLVRRLDWSVVVLFLGLFVWLHGFLQTGVPAALWGPRGLALAAADFTQARDIALLSVLLLPAAPLLGAVPAAVLLLGAGLRACAAQRRLVLLAAWLVSGAGANLTLYSSAATMAAVHKGVQALNYRLTFWQHLQFCFPTTIIITTVGLLLMYTLLLIPT